MASIEARKGAFAVKWRLGGKRSGAPQTLTLHIPAGHSPNATLKSAKAAKELAEARGHAITHDELRRILFDDIAVPAGTPLFDDWVTEYLDNRDGALDIQPDTLTRYGFILRKRAIPFFSGRYLTEITSEVVAEWVKWMIRTQRKPGGESISPETIRRAHAVVHGCLGAAVPKYLPFNPAARASGSRKHAALPKRTPYRGMFLRPREVDAILFNASPSSRVLFFTAYRSGLRLGELVVLRPRDLILVGRDPYIHVTRALKMDGSIGAPKSVASNRDVVISSDAADVLSNWITGKKRDDLVFTSPRGRRWEENNLRQHHWLKAVAAAQRCGEHPPPLPPKSRTGPRRQWRLDEVSTCTCPFRLTRDPRIHDLRHSHVSYLIERGWEAKDIQGRVGHADYQTTMNVYGHLWAKRGHAKRLDEVERMLAMADDELA